jgi:hypothetical protein
MYFAGFQTRKVGLVPRGPASAADRELTARLAARGLTGSRARYERWRRAGLLPRHKRRGAGRGRGSASVLAPATVDIAAVLARHAVQGRDLRAVVVAWFFEAGRPALPGQPVVPEPPDGAVPAALAWGVRADPGYRILRLARSAVTESQRDDFYAIAVERARRGPDVGSGFDPSAVREALLSGGDVHSVSSGARADVVHMVAVMGLGAEEVGAEAFADAIAASGLFPQLSAQEWRDAMIEAYASGAYAEDFAALMRFDPVNAVETASIERLRQAREVATGLAGFGALLVMHGLLMPDTPGLAALRGRISELGMGPLLMNLARQVMRPQGVAFAIATCLDPTYLALYKSLSEMVAAGPPLLHQTGADEHDPERYMEIWLSSIRELGNLGQADGKP